MTAPRFGRLSKVTMDSADTRPAQAPAMPQGSFVQDAWDWVLIACIFTAMAALAWGALTTAMLQPLYDIAERQHWGQFWVRPTVIWITMGLVLMLLRTLLWLRYRPWPAESMEEAPRLTVIIPAYNEGPMVMQAIGSVAAARYPADRLEIIVVDDGSRDDTWTHIRKAAARYAPLVNAIRLPENLGKRGALAEGFRKGTGEIFVTVDSDSVIEAGALLALAGPFRDPRIGAVAGKVAVLNRREALIPRMLHVRFMLSFDFLRSAQSVYRTVFCCPGALTAYRAELVRRLLPAWESQKFMGEPCTYGEDRALTNDVIAAGYDTVYQRSAVVHTIVPTTYAKLCRMYIRWDRSYIREELRFGRIVWRRPPRWRVLALYESTITNLRFPVAYGAMGLWVVNSIADPTSLLRMLFAIMVVSTFYALYFLRSERSWDFAFGILYGYFSFFALTWVFPYSAATLRARGWLTR